MKLFYPVAERVVMPIIEVIPVRKADQGGTQVLLLKQPNDDPNWPGQLHTPGTVMRMTDLETGGIQSAFDRIAHDEIGLNTQLNPQAVGFGFHRVSRGPKMANVFAVDLGEVNILPGTWYNVIHLPDNIVETQQGFIERPIQTFERIQS